MLTVSEPDAPCGAVCGLRRDVKGDNVLVSTADGRVFLTDFGSGNYVGAATLTSPPFPPGTPPYRSPEAWCSVQLPFSASAPPYAPGPADDVFALGMTAYRLVTGDYPPPTAPMGEEPSVWSLDGAGPPQPRIINVRCCGELSGLVARMLSVHFEARGSARELAEALAQATRMAGPDADVPLFSEEPFPPVEATAVFRRVVHRASRRGRPSWLLVASLGGLVALGAEWMLSAFRGEDAEQRHTSLTEDAKDGGAVAVGDAALTAPMPVVRAPSAWSTIAVVLPPKPLPGQTKPNAAGHCPRRGHVVINGGCWVQLAMPLKDCDDGYYVHQGACYGPVFPPARPSTSGPTERSGDVAP
jgi:serine/threonine protein kinase